MLTLSNKTITHNADQANTKIEMQMVSFEERMVMKMITAMNMSAENIMKNDSGVGMLCDRSIIRISRYRRQHVKKQDSMSKEHLTRTDSSKYTIQTKISDEIIPLELCHDSE